jgi:hypothetical protein
MLVWEPMKTVFPSAKFVRFGFVQVTLPGHVSVSSGVEATKMNVRSGPFAGMSGQVMLTEDVSSVLVVTNPMAVDPPATRKMAVCPT